jgi:hypothetical protein
VVRTHASWPDADSEDTTSARPNACRLSRLSHRLVSRGRIRANLPDNGQTLTCASGPRRTHRTTGTRLRIRWSRTGDA